MTITSERRCTRVVAYAQCHGRASFALLFLALAVQVVVGQLQVGPRPLPPQREIIVSTDCVDRLERWLKAVD